MKVLVILYVRAKIVIPDRLVVKMYVNHIEKKICLHINCAKSVFNGTGNVQFIFDKMKNQTDLRDLQNPKKLPSAILLCTKNMI